MRGRDPTSLALPRVMGRARLSEKTLDPGDKNRRVAGFFRFFPIFAIFSIFCKFCKKSEKSANPQKIAFFPDFGVGPRNPEKMAIFWGSKNPDFRDPGGVPPGPGPKTAKNHPRDPDPAGSGPRDPGFSCRATPKIRPRIRQKIDKISPDQSGTVRPTPHNCN